MMGKQGRKRGISLCHQIRDKEYEGQKTINDRLVENRVYRMKSSYHDGHQYLNSSHVLHNQSMVRYVSWQNPKIVFSYRGNNHFGTIKLNEGDNATATAKVILQQQSKPMKQQNKNGQLFTVKKPDFSQLNQSLNENLFEIIGRSSNKMEETVKNRNLQNCQEDIVDKQKTTNKNTLSAPKPNNFSEKKIGKSSTRKNIIAQEIEKRLLQIIKICSVKS